MTVRSALARGRGAQASLFVDACVIERETVAALDPTTNVLTPTVVTIYTGPCRLKAATTAPGLASSGEQAVTTRRYDLDLPWDAAGPIVVGDVAKITASDDAWAVYDADTNPRTFTVLDGGLSGSTTKRILKVEDRS